MNWTRRDVIKAMGMLSVGSSLYANDFKKVSRPYNPFTYDDPRHKKPLRPVTVIVIGAGNRGNVYASYAAKFPDELKVVGVAEPIEIRNKKMAKTHDIKPENCFKTWEDVFKVKKFADAVIVSTPDNLHYGPAMKALESGYHLLLEKPIAPTWQQCKDILQQSQKYNRIVAVCHVLRYSPYFKKIKEVLDSGVIGPIINIQHMEAVGYVHIAHAYVRGNWRRAEDSTPMILAKSCHDTDLIRWFAGQKCEKVASFGSLKWFRRENAPDGSTARCTDGCRIEADCPYSALKIYYRDRQWLGYFVFPEGQDQGEVILKNLKEGNYGKCVYKSDNDVVDHQVATMQFRDQITASFSMVGFNFKGCRHTKIEGAMGELYGDESILHVADFRKKELTQWKPEGVESGHGGGDFNLARDFVQAVSQEDPALLVSDIQTSMESHLIGFKAEESRLTNTVQIVDIDKL